MIESAFLAAFDTHHPPHPPFNVGAGELSRGAGSRVRSGVGARARSNIEWGVRGDRGYDFTGKIRPNSKRSEWIERGQNALLGGSPGADSKHPLGVFAVRPPGDSKQQTP